MANEVIGNKDRYFLVQIGQDGRERPMMQDYTGNLVSVDATQISVAKDFGSAETAKKVCDMQNMIYQFTGSSYKTKVVHEAIKREAMYQENEPKEETSSDNASETSSEGTDGQPYLKEY